MTDSLIIQKAIEEALNPQFGMTEEFLKIHKIRMNDGKPVVAGIVPDNEGNPAVFFEVEDERFYLVIYVNTVPETEVRWVDVEERSWIYLNTSSETYTIEELQAMTTLTGKIRVRKGDKRGMNGKGVYPRNVVYYEPTDGPGFFEHKLDATLSFLEQDAEGVRRLVEQADGYIHVIIEFHNGNSMLGGMHLDTEVIKRLAALNLSIDFDLHAVGKLFKEEDESYYDQA